MRRLLALLTIAGVTAGCGSANDVVQRSDQQLPSPELPTASAPAGSSASTDDTQDAPDVAEPTTAITGPPRTARLAFTGDTLPHSPLWRQAQRNTGGTGYDFFPMFAGIADVISSADLAVCHLETPIAPAGEEFSTDPLYGVPPEIARAMASAGYDRCSTASNHILDRYPRGIDRTINVLEENGIAQSGSARNQLESLPSVFDVNGISMSHLSYTYDTNGIPIPAGEPWRTNLIEPRRIIDDATAARDLGADFVMVSMHWGTEKVTAPNQQQVTVAAEVTASGAVDLIVGHHAHVVQPIAEVNGVWVAYGIGNILSNLPVNDRWPASSQDAVIVEFEVTVASNGAVDVAAPVVRPTWVDKDSGWVIRDVDTMLARSDLAEWRRTQLEASRERTSAVVGDFFATP